MFQSVNLADIFMSEFTVTQLIFCYISMCFAYIDCKYSRLQGIISN